MKAPILLWGRPLGFGGAACGLVDLGSQGSFLTACRGRWAMSDGLDIRATRLCAACLAYEAELLAGRGVEDVTDFAIVDPVEASNYRAVDLGTRFDFDFGSES